MSKRKEKQIKKRSIFKRLLRFILIMFLIVGILYGAFAVFNYMLGYQTIKNVDGTKSKVYVEKKKEINALICGTNQNLTDTIIYINHNIDTGITYMMSIPRDTYVNNEYCVGHKINAIYRGKNINPLVKEVEKLLGVNIDYYLIFNSDMLIQIVDAVGGVEVDVPIIMKYDDPTQDLHIDLQPGVQILDGKKSEQFVRYRKNNDGTGYAMGDLQRTQVQQSFVKSFISTILSIQNIPKLPSIVDIALTNTKTNVTSNEILRYSIDILKIDTSKIFSCTAPGTPKYINGVSYFILDSSDARKLVETKKVD